MMPKDLKGEKGAADRPNDGVDRVPGRIDPWHFVGEKFQQIKDAGDDNDPGLAEHFERLVARRKRDPMQMDREAGGENGEVKIDAGKAGEAERDGDRVKSIHGELSANRQRRQRK